MIFLAPYMSKRLIYRSYKEMPHLVLFVHGGAKISALFKFIQLKKECVRFM